MAPLTWREVAAPNFAGISTAGALQATQTASTLLNRGFEGMGSALEKFGEHRQKATDQEFLAELAGVTDADALGAKLQGGVPANVSAGALEFAMGRQGDLLVNDTRRHQNTGLAQKNQQNQWTFEQTQAFEAARPAAVQRATDIRSLAMQGTPESIQEANRLMAESADIFAAAGWQPTDATDFINGNASTSATGMAQQNAFSAIEDNRLDREQRDEAQILWQDVAAIGTSPEQMAEAVRASGAPLPVQLSVLDQIEQHGEAVLGPAPDAERQVLDMEIEEYRQNAQEALNVADPVEAVVNQIIGIESSWDPNAQNGLSSAGGLGGFINSTWIDMVKRHRPDLAAGKTDTQIISYKMNPELAREMTRAYTTENAQTLERNGLQVTPGNLYLSHHFGSGGAQTILTASDDTPLSDRLLGKGVMEANPHLAGKNVGWVKSWAHQKMTGGSGRPGQNTSQQRANQAIEHARSVSHENMSAQDQRSILDATTALNSRSNTLMDMGVTDEMFNETAPMLTELIERPNERLMPQEMARKLQEEIGEDEAGLSIPQMTAAINQAADHYKVAPDIAAALIKHAVTKTSWGWGWWENLKGSGGQMRIDDDRMAAHFRKFVDPTNPVNRMQPTLEQFEQLRFRQAGTEQIARLTQELEEAKDEHFRAQQLAKRNPNADVDTQGPLLRLQALMTKLQNTTGELENHPLWTAHSRSRTNN